MATAHALARNMVLSPLPHNFFRNCVALFIVDYFPAVLLSLVDV
jgi:hypothetical protein